MVSAQILNSHICERVSTRRDRENFYLEDTDKTLLLQI